MLGQIREVQIIEVRLVRLERYGWSDQRGTVGQIREVQWVRLERYGGSLHDNGEAPRPTLHTQNDG